MSSEYTKAENYQEGWLTHPGTFCGHYFGAGEFISLCRKERRAIGGKVLDDCLSKCGNCLKKIETPRTKNLFAEID